MTSYDLPQRARRWPWFIVALLVSVGLLYGGDRILHARAEDRVEQLVLDQLPAATDLVVDIDGSLFLPQYLSGSMDGVRITATDAQVSGITLTDVDVLAADVTTEAPYIAGRLDLAATVPAQAMEAALRSTSVPIDIDLTIENGLVVARAGLLGLNLEIGLSLQPHERSIGTRIETIALAGLRIPASQLPAGLVDALSRLEVPLDALPDGITLTGLEMLPDGVRVTATGTDVVVHR